jgi:hypothetical protein
MVGTLMDEGPGGRTTEPDDPRRASRALGSEAVAHIWNDWRARPTRCDVIRQGRLTD